MTAPHQTQAPRAGQTLGVVAPAYTVDEDDRIQAGIETVESLGFRVKPGQHLFRRHGYFADTDQATLPIGYEVELDAGARTLTLLEPAVS